MRKLICTIAMLGISTIYPISPLDAKGREIVYIDGTQHAVGSQAQRIAKTATFWDYSQGGFKPFTSCRLKSKKPDNEPRRGAAIHEKHMLAEDRCSQISGVFTTQMSYGLGDCRVRTSSPNFSSLTGQLHIHAIKTLDDLRKAYSCEPALVSNTVKAFKEKKGTRRTGHKKQYESLHGLQLWAVSFAGHNGNLSEAFFLVDAGGNVVDKEVANDAHRWGMVARKPRERERCLTKDEIAEGYNSFSSD